MLKNKKERDKAKKEKCQWNGSKKKGALAKRLRDNGHSRKTVR